MLPCASGVLLVPSSCRRCACQHGSPLRSEDRRRRRCRCCCIPPARGWPSAFVRHSGWCPKVDIQPSDGHQFVRSLQDEYEHCTAYSGHKHSPACNPGEDMNTTKPEVDTHVTQYVARQWIWTLYSLNGHKNYRWKWTLYNLKWTH